VPEIGISGLPLDYPFSGSAVYVRNLVRELPAAAPDLSFRLFTRSAGESSNLLRQRISSPFGRINHGHGAVARLDKLTWEVGTLPIASAMRRQALLHSTYFASPVVANCPLVVTVHDVIPLVVPGYHRSRQAALYSRFMAWNVPRVTRSIITVSEHAKRDIVRVLGVADERVHVTYEAVEARFHPDQPSSALEQVKAKYHLPERFALYLGGAERRKNIETLIRAWARAVRALRDRELKLVVVARFPPPDDLYPDIPGLVRSEGLDRDIILISHVDECDKPALYAASLLFCFPSLYEGFGFPPLEAMASGVPVLCSNASSLPEVVGDAARTVPPEDVEAWRDAIVRLTDSESERARLASLGLKRAAEFSWSRTAQQTVAIYRHLLSS
jgi:glycosyltransferase involved in cell wall biosynthesis